tara:strand:- start:2184 stop:3011 length:828 start_codon:yes stop_codon:yes gene_type:complete
MDIRSFFKVIPSKQTSNNEISKFAGPKNDIHGEKKVIIDTFMKNVKGKKYDKNGNNKHCGSEGHWLEEQMNIKPNSLNEPDNLGYEQKKYSSKITFGDWSASKYRFHEKDLTRKEFLESFGSKNPIKNNRYSWSGKVFPKYGNDYNDAGQRIRFLENDLVIEYSYHHDKREDKIYFKPLLVSEEPIQLAIWYENKLKAHIERKFGVNGFYMCKKNENNVYDKICFGKTIDFQFFKKCIQNKSIILDSGMYEGNSRNYSQFRANKSLWDSLITEEY